MDGNKRRRICAIRIGLSTNIRRLTEHNDELTATIDLSRLYLRSERCKASTSNLFVDLRKLSAERGRTIGARSLREVAKGCRDSITRFIDDTGALIRRKCPNHTPTIGPAPWEKSLKTPTRTCNSGRHNRRE
jgi:hypothetical protein